MSRVKAAKRARWRPSKTKGVMNATEKRFESSVLRTLQLTGEISSWQYEPAKWRYGTDFKATYTPDFMVLRADGMIEMIDVKGSGGWEAATRNKIKACAEKYPQFLWVGYTEDRKRRSNFAREEF